MCPCFEGYYRAAREPPEMECTRKSHVVVLESTACSVVSCMVWWGRIRSGCYGSGRTSNVLSYLKNKSTDDMVTSQHYRHVNSRKVIHRKVLEWGDDNWGECE